LENESSNAFATIVYENGHIVIVPADEGIFNVEGVFRGDIDETAFAFNSWDSEVIDEDAGESDVSQIWGLSEYLKWNEVELTPYHIKAPSLKRAKEALKHVSFGTYNPLDM